VAALIELQDLRGGYVDLVKHVREEGTTARPRGQEVRECLNVTVTIADPTQAVPWDVGRKMNPDILAAETAHLIGGLSDLEQMRSVAHIFGSFSNDGKLLGAYGPRTAHQIPLVLGRICDDPDTRQGVSTIWNQLELVNKDNRDMPCTVALTWTLRNGKLNMQTFMRSNDVFLGVTYDYPMFTRLQIAMAYALGVGVGEYVHTAVNLHLYERDVQKTLALHKPEAQEVPADLPFAPTPRTWDLGDRPLPLSLVEERWYRVRCWMEAAALGKPLTDDAPPEAQWYADRLARHVSGGTMSMYSRYVLADGLPASA
jgi:hypothetical protein